MGKTAEQKAKHAAYMREYYRKKTGWNGQAPGRPQNTPEILWGKVEKRGQDECWPWKGWIGSGGYGRTQINGKAYYAHRVIFNLVNPGVIDLEAPKDRLAVGYLLHTCDNPPCCNPAHLRVGTHLDNMQDRHKKGRYQLPKGEKHHAAVFTDAERAEIVRLHKIDGLTCTQIAERFSANKNTIKSVLYMANRGG